SSSMSSARLGGTGNGRRATRDVQRGAAELARGLATRDSDDTSPANVIAPIVGAITTLTTVGELAKVMRERLESTTRGGPAFPRPRGPPRDRVGLCSALRERDRLVVSDDRG